MVFVYCLLRAVDNNTFAQRKYLFFHFVLCLGVVMAVSSRTGVHM